MTSHFGGSGGELIGGGQVSVTLANPARSTTARRGQSWDCRSLRSDKREESDETAIATVERSERHRRCQTARGAMPNFPTASALGKFGQSAAVTTWSPGPAPPVISKCARRATVF